jgi:hypothetical protein
MARNGPNAVLRIRVRRRGQRWSIEKVTHVEAMTLPPSRRLPASGGRPLSGAWCELADGAGEVLYRTALPHPPGGGVEVPAEEGGLHRVDAEREEDVFDVLVPDDGRARDLLVYVADPRANDTTATVARSQTPVARMSLQSPRQG